ncbi:hypothetical protein LCGC14_1337620 [marine sediment metagenome]|uniref:Uncharacterized protein n=1 Tax=marine sediment metagenome TaxID=412755 RepID=A0A0F9KFD5_9ZZZZ
MPDLFGYLWLGALVAAAFCLYILPIIIDVYRLYFPSAYPPFRPYTGPPDGRGAVFSHEAMRFLMEEPPDA